MSKTQEFCKEILKVDSKIRFVGLWHDDNIFYELRKGLSPLLEKTEVEQSIRSAVLRWDTRMAQDKKLGVPGFSLTRYDQIYRITLPLDDDLLFFSTDLDCDILNTIHIVQNIKNELNP